MREAALIYWFSGTGHAWQVARQTGEALARFGIDAVLRPAEEGPHPRHERFRRIGIVTAVYGFGLPDIMDRFLWDLPRADAGQEALVLAVTGHHETLRLGSFSFHVPPTEGVTLIQAASYLRRRGYRVRGLERVEMPNSWILPVDAPDEASCRALVAPAMAAVDDFVDRLQSGAEPHRLIHPLLAVLLGTVYLYFVVVARRFLGKTFVVTDRCTACGRCVAECPQQTIAFRDRRPDWHWDCQQCFRCIHRCPEAAIEISALSLTGLVMFPWLIGRLLGFPSRSRRGFRASVFFDLCDLLLAFLAVWGLDQWRKTSWGHYLPDRWLTTGRRRLHNADFQPARERYRSRRL